MGLRAALTNPELLAFDGELAHLVVTADAWSIEAISQADAEQWWADHAPDPVELPPKNLAETSFRDITDVTPEPTGEETLRDNIRRRCRLRR
jgi:hypothetical protein